MNSFTGYLRGVLAAADILQTVFSGTLAIAARLLAVSGVMENIQHFPTTIA